MTIEKINSPITNNTLVNKVNEVIDNLNNESVNIDNNTITENTNNELQAVGLINPQSNIAIKIWEGTEQQWNTGGGSVTYYNWQSGGAQVVTTNIDIYPKGATFGNNTYVVVGNSGKIATSSNGETWTLQTSGVSENLTSVIFDGTNFIAVGINGTIIKSTNGETWTLLANIPAGYCRSIAYGNNIYAIGTNNGVYYSSDLNTWSNIDVNTGNKNISTGGKVVFHKNNFYTAALSGMADALRIYKSADAVTWTNTTATGVFDAYWYDLSAAGNYLYGATAYSSDEGSTWVDFSPTNIHGAIYANNMYVGINGSSFSKSSDGVTWENIKPFGDAETPIIYANNSFVAFSYATGNFLSILTYGSGVPLSVFTKDENPTISSTVYSAPNTTSALTITSVGTGTITLSDTNTYDYNASGNQTTTQTVGEAHPDWICSIEGIGVKKGNVLIADNTTLTATGSAIQPVYIASNGTITATTYSLAKSVPADAVFTDTTYSVFTGAQASAAGTTGLVPAPTSGETSKFLKSDGSWDTVGITATYDSTTETLTII